ncbi:MAG TPA: hypothetical protein VF420_17635 [Casimicrobiaceae bacterium]
MRVDPDAPADEAQGGKTLAGTPVNKRGEECFPTYEGDLFKDLDLLYRADREDRKDRKGSSVFDKAKEKPNPKDPEELAKAIRGQSSWMLWSEGDEAFWGWLVEHNYGFTDFLILLDSRQREHRFHDAGLVNQPGMTAQKDPAKKILGLYLDQNRGAPGGVAYNYGGAGCAPFEPTDEEHYTKALADLASDGADPDVYGYPSGVVGLRLFPNPDFFAKTDAAAEARRYWKIRVEDQPEDDYYKPESLIAADPKLVRPFRIGMTCAFCHIGPHPLQPPENPEKPEWANLSSTIGAQYWTGAKAFSNLKGPKSFLFQLVQSWQPGTLDTSLISTDQINNPNTMNAVWEMPARMGRAMLNPPEAQSAANLLIPSIEDQTANPRHTPRILIDGSDSVGISGALSRVYLNIGAYYEQWIRLHNPILGFRAQRPFEMATIRDQSVFWRVTEKQRVPEIIAFFTYKNSVGENVTQPMKLADALGGDPHPDAVEVQKKGRAVFVENCAICHSSKQPTDFALTFSRKWRIQPVPGSGEAAHFVLPMDFAEWEEFKRSAPYQEYVKRISETAGVATAGSDPFLVGNYLSTDIRVPVTLVGTNSSRAVGTNAMKGQVWDNFSSDAYKNLPAVGKVHFYNPYSGQPVDEWGNNDVYEPPAGGPGYYRPASLVSIWATAPFLHNNALGRYTGDPSVGGRLEAFDDAIDKLLSKAKRVPSAKDRPGDLRHAHPALAGHDPGFIYRTTTASWIDFPATFIRPLLVGVMGESLTSWLTRYIWYVLAGIAILFAFFGRQQHAGFTLVIIAVATGVVLRVLGIDTIYPSLWWLPAVAVAVALLLWLGPQARGVAPVFFALLGTGFLLVSFVATSWVDGKRGGISLGPIPQGTPVNLLMSFNPQAPKRDLLDAVSGLTRGLLRVRKDYPLLAARVSADALKQHVDGDDSQHYNASALGAFEREAGLPLLKVSKCPDFVLDRGHWFAEGLSDEQKQQLKAFLKTL